VHATRLDGVIHFFLLCPGISVMMHRRSFTVVLTVSLLAARAVAADYFVAPDGSDSNPGSLERPFATITKAQAAAAPGDTVYFRGGKYVVTSDQIHTPLMGVAAHVFDITKSGKANAPIRYFAYQDEHPVFDFSAVKPGPRVYAFVVTADWVHFRGLEVTGVQVTQTGHTQSECFENHGSHNIYERLSMHDGMAIGFFLLGGSDNLILNCDAYRNWDSVSEGGRGGNTDGFGCHPKNKGDTGNVFRGCRSWLNSDDGYDCINAAEGTTFDHCWAMYNGFNAAHESLGDGNGFKAGGYGRTAIEKLPHPIPRNTVQFCLAVGNKASGFYANHHIGGGDWINNTGYKNGTNFNMLERLPDNQTDIPGPGQFMRNNLGFDGGHELLNLDAAKSDASSNSFDMKLHISAADFESLDESQLTGPRKPDGSLPDITFMHLAKGSPLIDKGVAIKNDNGDIRFPFNGAAPDLGCFESGPSHP
jgi:hypothetical protein